MESLHNGLEPIHPPTLLREGAGPSGVLILQQAFRTTRPGSSINQRNPVSCRIATRQRRPPRVHSFNNKKHPMKTNRTSWLAAGISLLLASFVPAARAATVAYTTGDLVLAFRADGGTGASQSLLIGIGAASLYNAAVGNPNLTLNVGTFGADLLATYGSGWFDRTDLTWSVFGANDTANPSATLYASRAQTTFGTSAAAWPVLTNASHRTATRGEISAVTTAFAGLEATANSAVSALQTNSSDPSSYSQQVTFGSTDFGSLSQWTNIQGNFGPGSEALSLFRLNASTTNLGAFTISNAGAVTFSGTSVNIVPEPSKAVFSMLGTTLLLLRRRRPAVRA